jgi:adenosylhomocysteine nucleosidase
MGLKKLFPALALAALSVLAVPAAPAAGAGLMLAGEEAALAPLRARLAAPHEERFGAWTFWSGELAGKTVVLARTEDDPLNAVAATTLGVRHYHPRLIVVFGAARAHDPALRPFDAVVSEKFVPFDGFISTRRDLGAGLAPEQWEKLPELAMTAGEQQVEMESFPADAAALALARALADPRGRVVAGVLGSSGQVNREADRLAWLHAHWGTSCEDGESAHVAACAHLLATPVVGVRVIATEATWPQAEILAAAMAEQLAEVLK